MPKKRYMANPEVSCRQEADGAAIFNPDTNDLVAINAVGCLIWLVLARLCTRQDIVAHLVATCQDLSAEQVAADVAAFLQMLLPRGFVGQVWEGDSPLPDLTTTGAHSPPARPLAHTAPEQEGPRHYQGHSMAGTFRPGDYLTIEPATLASIRPGDVVICRGHNPAGEPADVVHRVVAVSPGGLVTRGDNNPRVDDGLVTRDTLLGWVTHRERAGQVRRVRGGRWGMLQLRARRAWRRIRQPGWRLLRAVGRPAIRWLRASGLVRRLWQPDLTRLLITTGEDSLVQYVSGRRVVARWQPARGTFSWRRPYDLVIPRPDARGSDHE